MTRALTLQMPGADEIRAEYASELSGMGELAIHDAATHALAQERLLVIARARKRVEERLDPIIAHAHGAHKELCKLRTDLMRPLDEARQLIANALSDYEARERQRAEAERLRLEEMARQREEEIVLAQAEMLERNGQSQEADSLLSRPVETPIISVASGLAQVDGVTSHARYSAEVTDLLALVRYVAEHPAMLNLLRPDQSAINAMARAQKELLALPGVRVVRGDVRRVWTGSFPF